MPRHQPGRSADRSPALPRVPAAAPARTVPARTRRGRTGVRSPRRRRTWKPHQGEAMRQTARWCESLNATTDPSGLLDPGRTGSARRQAAGSITPTETAHPAPAPQHGPPAQRRPRWTTGRRSPPDTRRRPRPPRRSAARPPAAQTRNSGPPHAPAIPGAQGAAPRRGAPDRRPPRPPPRRSGRRGQRRRS